MILSKYDIKHFINLIGSGISKRKVCLFSLFLICLSFSQSAICQTSSLTINNSAPCGFYISAMANDNVCSLTSFVFQYIAPCSTTIVPAPFPANPLYEWTDVLIISAGGVCGPPPVPKKCPTPPTNNQVQLGNFFVTGFGFTPNLTCSWGTKPSSGLLDCCVGPTLTATWTSPFVINI